MWRVEQCPQSDSNLHTTGNRRRRWTYSSLCDRERRGSLGKDKWCCARLSRSFLQHGIPPNFHVQTCIRLAIDAGAGLILPSATERDEDHLVKTNGAVHVCPEVFFNTEYLQTSMREQCPQFKLRMCDDRSGIKHVLETPKRHYLDAAHSNGTFRQYVEEVFQRSPLNLTDVSAKNPAVVNFGDSFIGWNYRKSGEVSDQFCPFSF